LESTKWASVGFWRWWWASISLEVVRLGRGRYRSFIAQAASLLLEEPTFRFGRYASLANVILLSPSSLFPFVTVSAVLGMRCEGWPKSFSYMVFGRWSLKPWCWSSLNVRVSGLLGVLVLTKLEEFRVYCSSQRFLNFLLIFAVGNGDHGCWMVCIEWCLLPAVIAILLILLTMGIWDSLLVTHAGSRLRSIGTFVPCQCGTCLLRTNSIFMYVEWRRWRRINHVEGPWDSPSFGGQATEAPSFNTLPVICKSTSDSPFASNNLRLPHVD